jgi:hypothetical protein
MYYTRLPIFKHGNQSSNTDLKCNKIMYQEGIL